MLATIFLVVVGGLCLVLKFTLGRKLKAPLARLDQEVISPKDLSRLTVVELGVDAAWMTALDGAYFNTPKRKAQPRYVALQSFSDRLIARRDEMLQTGELKLDSE